MTPNPSSEATSIVQVLTGANPPHAANAISPTSLSGVDKVIGVAGLLSATPADVDSSEIPKTLAELNLAINRSYDLSVTQAGDLNIPVIGSAGGSHSRRVVVLERTAYKNVFGHSGVEYHFGYALRLCLTVNKWDANLKVSLPFLAASAQMGQVEASWMLQVVGLAGSKLAAAIAPPAELNVETFVIAKQSLTALIDAVNDTSTAFAAVQLAKIEPKDILEAEYRKGAAKTYALSRIARRGSLADTLDRIRSGDSVINDTIRETYGQFVGGADTERPSEDAARKSRELLGGIQADV